MARKRSSNSMLTHMMDMLLELTDFSWKFGAVITVLLSVLAGVAFGWAVDYNTPENPSQFAGAITGTFGWIMYCFPIFFLLMAFLFAWRACITFSKRSNF